MSRRRVLTLLDFIFEVEAVQYNYPTIIFYQLGTNLTTMWQSSRRSYRLIQTKECRTYYIAYQGTLQQSVLELMGEKKMATSILQGKFSASALTTDNDLDVRYRLMKELDNNIKATNINTVEAHFKKMNEEEQNREIPEADRLFLEEMRRKRQELLKQKKLEQEKAIEDALDAAIEVFDLFLLGSEEADNIEVDDVPPVLDVSSFSESEEAEEEEVFDIGFDLKSGQFKLF